MQIRLFLKTITLISIVLLISGCAFFFYPPTGEIDTVNIKVNFSVDGTLPSGKGYIGLFNEMNELIQMQEASKAGTYDFSNVELQHPNMTYRKTKVAFFIDANNNGKYDSTNIDESQSFAVTSVLDMQLYTEEASKEEVVNVNAMIFKVSGYINFHPDMGSDQDRKYLYWKGSKDSTYKIAKSQVDGSFEFYEGTRNDGSIMELYAFYDVDGDGMMNQLVDRVTFINLFGTYDEIYISPINITKVYGTLDLNGIASSDIYNLNAEPSGTGNRAIIRVENQVLWRSWYVVPESNGDFNIFIIPLLTTDIVLFHVKPEITDYKTQFQDHLAYPVRLAGPLSFPDDPQTEINGASGPGDALAIHKVMLTINNMSSRDFGRNQLVLRVYRIEWLDLKVQLIPDDGSSGLAAGESKTYNFYIRDFHSTESPPVNGSSTAVLTFEYFDDINKNFLLEKAIEEYNVITTYPTITTNIIADYDLL